MGIIRSIRGFSPQLGVSCFIAENAVIIGDVVAGDFCSFWYSSVVRGDVNSIRIANKVNIQDGAVLHTLYKKSVIEIADNVTISHNVTIHGAKIEENVLIGIGSVVMDHAVIGKNSIIAAGSVVLSNTITEPFSIYGGVPAKKLKDISPDQVKEMIERISENYIMYAGWYKENE
jgi:carbonic anhydrase/acetyltransferase-like protein (isoleucine patch superfamily)